jgi:hypothetical protein
MLERPARRVLLVIEPALVKLRLPSQPLLVFLLVALELLLDGLLLEYAELGLELALEVVAGLGKQRVAMDHAALIDKGPSAASGRPRAGGFERAHRAGSY